MLQVYFSFAQRNPWAIVALCVLCSATADTASKFVMEGKGNWWVWAVMLGGAVSTYIFFGTVASLKGLSVTSGITNSLVALAPVMIGLVVLREFEKISKLEFLGIVIVLVGIGCIIFGGKSEGVAAAPTGQLPPAAQAGMGAATAAKNQ